jgi:hypothetical protein
MSFCRAGNGSSVSSSFFAISTSTRPSMTRMVSTSESDSCCRAHRNKAWISVKSMDNGHLLPATLAGLVKQGQPLLQLDDASPRASGKPG